MSRKIVLEDLDTKPHDIFSHQNEDIVRLTPDHLKARLAKKDAKKAAAGDD
jgi:hypothetical protein